MGRGVAEPLPFVVAPGDDGSRIGADDHGTHGHVVVIKGGTRLVESGSHEHVVVQLHQPYSIANEPLDP
jgi:hypothetical protein